MRNLNIILVTILFAAFTFTSCEKESITELQDSTTTVAATNERGIPAAGIHIVNEAVQTQATAKTISQRASSRSRTVTAIDCGTDYDGCTKGQGSSLNINNYPSCIRDLNASFNGEDQLFYLVVPSTPEAIVTYEIELTGMSQDLDLFLLALDANGYIADCKAISINAGATDEKISVTGLAPGAYAVVVDAYKGGIVSHFNLAVYCSAVSANPPTITETAASQVTSVQFGIKDENGSASLGQFTKREGTTWNEYGVIIPHFPLDSDFNPAIYTFQEVAQDDWSIYLRDDSRGVNIQLDLHRWKVVYSDDQGNAFDLYDIL